MALLRYMEKLREKANLLPETPGCYLMKDRTGRVIYVGKAKVLRKRVLSYFSDQEYRFDSAKTKIMVSHVSDFDFILTSSDSEALVLENNLIKKYYPRYNILLKDDKSYPYVVIDYTHPFPRLEYVRRPKTNRDNKQIFGPFVTGSNIREIIRILTKSFALRGCSNQEYNNCKKAERPCIRYQMKQCSAPCVNYISQSDYLKKLESALKLFTSQGSKSIRQLEKVMAEHAEREEYEAAAIIRDSVLDLKNFVEISVQKNVDLKDQDLDLDVVAFYQGDKEIDISIYLLRKGILLGHKNFNFLVSEVLDDLDEALLGYLFQYYTTSSEELPLKIILPFSKEILSEFKSGLEKYFSKKISVAPPGKKFGPLMKLVEKHAEESQRMRMANEGSLYEGLNKLKELLNMEERPHLIECFDVAVWQGSSPTASQVVFEDGRAARDLYRYYHLKERPEGNNDFAMLKEAMGRRVDNGNLPDLFVVDGGISQVNSIKLILDEARINIPVVGIAKARNLSGDQGHERLIIPGRANPYLLAKNSILYRIMIQMRDEAHRFSRKLHHKAEKSRLFSSWLDDIDGIGPKIKEKILKRIDVGNKDILTQLSNMSVEEIKVFLGLSEQLCQNIFDYFKNTSN